MKTAVLIICLIGMTCAYPVSDSSDSSHQSSSESHSISKSDSHSDSSSEEVSIAPPPNETTPGQDIVTEEYFARGDSMRRKRAAGKFSDSLDQDTISSESHSVSNSDSQSDSSSEEVSTAPMPAGTTAIEERGDSLRKRRSAEQDAHGSSSQQTDESVTTESTSRSDSSEEDSDEHSTKQNLVQGILGATPVPDTSEESSEERTVNTPLFEP